MFEHLQSQGFVLKDSRADVGSTIFDLFNAPEPLLDNEVLSPFHQGKPGIQTYRQLQITPITLRFFSEEFK